MANQGQLAGGKTIHRNRNLTVTLCQQTLHAAGDYRGHLLQLFVRGFVHLGSMNLISPAGSLLSSADRLQDMNALSMSAHIASLTDLDLHDVAGRQPAPEELTGLRDLMETALLSDAQVQERYQENAEAVFALLAQLRPNLMEEARQMRAAMGPVVASSGLNELRLAYE